MTRHAKVMAASGVKLVDPNPLLGATDRPDKLHTSLTEENMSNTVMWYRALVSGTITDRMITDLRPEFVANRREVVFYEHFHLNKPDSRLTVPGSMDLRVKPTPGLEVLPEVRDDDEQIVLTVPLLAPIQNLLLTEAEELTEVDRALLDTTPGAENVIQNTEDENDPAVVVTKMQLEGQGPSAAASSSSSSGLLRPTEVPGKSSGAAPIEPKQPPTPKKMPTAAIKSPPAAKAIAKSEASPPGRDGQFWIAGTDLPPLASDHRYLNAQKCEKLGRKISFILRGFTNKPEFGTGHPHAQHRLVTRRLVGRLE